MKINNFKYAVLLILGLFIVLVGCDNGSDEKPDPVIKEEVKLEVSAINSLEVGETAKIDYTLTGNKEEYDLTITVDKTDILEVIDNESIKAKKAGTAKVTVMYTDGEELLEKTIEINVVNPTFTVTFGLDGNLLYSSVEKYDLQMKVSKETGVSKAGFKYESDNEAVATIDEKGLISTIGEGDAKITITSKLDESLKYYFNVNVKIDAIAILESYNIAEPLYKDVVTNGNSQIHQMVKGSVNYYSPMELNLIEKIIPITTGSPYAGKVANETMVAEADKACKYVRSGILHTETTKITYHDTGNNTAGANADMHARYMVGDANLASRARSWHYTVDSTCAIHHIPDEEVTWQGDSYEAYSTSIGIETCVNEGSELDITWHRTAKLMASLLVKHNMEITDIVQHYYWNKKECPWTLRNNNLYPYAIEMVQAEYDAITILKDYTIEFESLNPSLVDNDGHIVKIPETATEVGYIVKVTDKDGNTESKVLYTVIPGADGTKKVSFETKNIEEFINLLVISNKDNVDELLAKYESLTEEEKANIFAMEYFLNKLGEINGKLATSLTIEEVYTGNDYRYKYFEIKNNSNIAVSMKNYYVKYTANGETKKFNLNDKSIGSGVTFIIYAGKNDVEEDIENEEVLYPDMALDITLASAGKIELYDLSDNLIDSLEYSTDLTRVSSCGDNNKDFLKLYPSPSNSKGETYAIRDGVKGKIIDVEVAILYIPSEVTKDDGELINHAYELYNALTSKEKLKVRNFTNLKNLKAKYDALD